MLYIGIVCVIFSRFEWHNACLVQNGVDSVMHHTANIIYVGDIVCTACTQPPAKVQQFDICVAQNVPFDILQSIARFAGGASTCIIHTSDVCV